MKKKIVALCLVAAMAVTAVVGGTLAYFTDTDAKDNTFTTGNVDIALDENFDNESKVMPGVDVTKQVSVENTGSEEAYVRVHIAIPAILDNGYAEFDAGKNALHFNYLNSSLGADLWDWTESGTDGKYDGKVWNYYETKVHDDSLNKDIDYHVYVVTYGKALAPNGEEGSKTAANAMEKVYLDPHTSQDTMKVYKDALGDKWHILVAAEGTQAAGFKDAYTALNTSFGTIDIANRTYNGKIDWSKILNDATYDAKKN